MNNIRENSDFLFNKKRNITMNEKTFLFPVSIILDIGNYGRCTDETLPFRI